MIQPNGEAQYPLSFARKMGNFYGPFPSDACVCGYVRQAHPRLGCDVFKIAQGRGKDGMPQ